MEEAQKELCTVCVASWQVLLLCVIWHYKKNSHPNPLNEYILQTVGEVGLSLTAKYFVGEENKTKKEKFSKTPSPFQCEQQALSKKMHTPKREEYTWQNGAKKGGIDDSTKNACQSDSAQIKAKDRLCKVTLSVRSLVTYL